jgi:type III restriction enzyme
MKLKFKNQDFQEAATAAVCDVFEGQPYHDPNVYTVDPGRKGVRDLEPGVSVGSSLPGFETLSQATMDFQDEPEVGYKNAEIKLPIDVLRENLHRVQNRQNLELSKLTPNHYPLTTFSLNLKLKWRRERERHSFIRRRSLS